MRFMSTLFLLTVPGLVAAQQTRELGAHQHGHSTLNIAIEGTQVALELTAPGADIVGFEYQPQTQQDRALMDAAIAALSEPLSLFVLPAAAGCSVVSSAAGLNAAVDDDHADHDHAGHDHAADDHADHDHGDHDHADDDHATKDAAEHSEFHAEYLLNCSAPGAIDRIDFAFFGVFPNAREVDVQMITDQGAQSFEVERDEPLLDLAGLI